jgi:predicted nucleotide-binding protein
MIKIFIASSSAAKRQAKMFMEGCEHQNIKFIPWWDEFQPGRTLLDELTRIKSEVHAALLIMTPEGVSTSPKGKEVIIPNLNVLFEFGFFYSAFGHPNVAVVKYGNVSLPSDLGGYIHINGSEFFKHNAGVAVGKRTKSEFYRWLDAMITTKK